MAGDVGEPLVGGAGLLAPTRLALSWRLIAGGLRPASPKCGVGLAVSTASNAATVRRTRLTSLVAMPRLSKREAPSVYAVLLTATTSSVLSLAWLCALALGLEALDRLGCRGTESFEDYSDPVLRLGAPTRVATQPRPCPG